MEDTEQETLAVDRVSFQSTSMTSCPTLERLSTVLCPLRLSCVSSVERVQSGLSWYRLFRQSYSDLGRYVHCYASLKTAWEQLKSFLQQRCPRIIASLKGDAAPGHEHPRVQSDADTLSLCVPLCPRVQTAPRRRS